MESAAPFKVKLIRPPFEVEFEAGSIGEANSILSAEGTELQKLFGITFGATSGNEAPEPAAAETDSGKKERKPRTPKTEATAPAPMPVPGAAPPAPPSLVLPADGGIPAFLDRTAAAPPPPPLMPAAPPIAPTPPVSGPVGQKVIAALEIRATSDEAKTQISDWLAASGLTVPKATYDECVACLRMLPDEKFAAVATALGV